MSNWLEQEVAFYDFIWKEGLSLCGECITNELLKDFQDGGDKFKKMKLQILKKFPTREIAEKAFRVEVESDKNQSGN